MGKSVLTPKETLHHSIGHAPFDGIVGVVVAVGNCCGQSCLRQHMEKPLALVLVDVTMGEREFGQHSETGLWGTRGFEAVNDGGSREGSRRLWRVLFSLWRRVRLRISFQMEKGAWRSNFLMLQTHQATRGKAARQTSRSRSVDYSYESPTRDRHYNINCVVCAGTWFWWRKLLELCVRGSLMNGPYRAPHPDSEVNSLWSMEQWDQGKSAKSMRNFGRSIGSKGWTRAGPNGVGRLCPLCCSRRPIARLRCHRCDRAAGRSNAEPDRPMASDWRRLCACVRARAHSLRLSSLRTADLELALRRGI